MAIVPTYNPTEKPVVGQGIEPYRFRDYSGAVPNAQPLVSRTASEGAKLFAKYQNEADDARAVDVYTELYKTAQDRQKGENGWENLLEKNALEPDADGKGMVEREQDALKARFEELTSGLTAGAREKALQKVQPIFRNVYSLTSSHVLKQGEAYQDATDKSYLSSMVTSAGDNFDKPEIVDGALSTALDRVREIGKRKGLPVQEIEANVTAMRDSVVASAIGAALEKGKENKSYNVYGRGIFESYKDKLSGAASAKLYAAIKSAQDNAQIEDTAAAGVKELQKARLSFQIAGNATARANDVSAGSTAELYHVGVVGQESGGRQLDNNGLPLVGRYKNGTMPRDEEKAYGAAQMQLGTAMDTAKREGIAFDKDRFLHDKEYSLRLGQLHFDYLVKRFGGDTDKAIAAYNQGEGRIKKLVDTWGTNWASHMTANGKEYLTKVKSRVELARKGVKKDAQGNEVNPMTPQYALSADQYFTREDAEKWVQERDIRAQTDTEYREKIVDKMMKARQDTMNDDRVTQANRIGNCIDKIVRGEELTNDDYAGLTVASQDKIKQVQAKLAAGDDSGDFALAAKFLANPDFRQGLSQREMENMIMTFPKRYRDKARMTWYTEHEQTAMAADKRAAEADAAGGPGMALPKYRVDVSKVEPHLKRIIGEDKWNKMSGIAREQMLLQTADFLSREAQSRGAPYKDSQEIASRLLDANLGNAFNVTTWWGFGPNKDKTLYDMKKGDLTNRGPTDVWGVLTQLTKKRNDERGYTLPPSDDQIMDTLRDIYAGGFPQINLYGIKLDEKLWEYLRSQSEDNARHTGGKIANDLQLLQAYIKFAVSGQHVYTPKEAPAPLTRAGRILSSAADEAEREAGYEESLW